MNLKPCPFCGGKARVDYAIYDYNRWGVTCESCGATVEVNDWDGEENTKENAVARWNRRWKTTSTDGSISIPFVWLTEENYDEWVEKIKHLAEDGK